MKSFASLAVIATILTAAPAGAQGAKVAAPVSTSPYDKAPWWMRESVITQTGFVFTEVPANRASFSASFETTADTADKAQARSIAQTKALMQALGKLGKDAVRVNTSFAMRTLYEQYRDKNGNRIEDQRGDKINGYQVTLNLSVEVRDTSILEKAYALVLAASPTSSTPVNFSLQPDNATNTWLYSQAVKDARARATQSVDAAGGRLGAIKVIDPTGRACETDILGPGAKDPYDGTQPQEVMMESRRVAPMAYAAAPPPPAPMMDGVAQLEAKALANPFIQTPPLQRLEAKACVVYGLN